MSNGLNNCFAATELKNGLFPFGWESLSHIPQNADSEKRKIFDNRESISTLPPVCIVFNNLSPSHLWLPEGLELFVKERENPKRLGKPARLFWLFWLFSVFFCLCSPVVSRGTGTFCQTA